MTEELEELTLEDLGIVFSDESERKYALREAFLFMKTEKVLFFKATCSAWSEWSVCSSVCSQGSQNRTATTISKGPRCIEQGEELVTEQTCGRKR